MVNSANPAPIWEKEASAFRRTCMLLITYECNLNCTYCYEHHKCNKKMSFDIARSLILKECDIVRNSKIFKELEIDLMGGEPMMNFELVKQLVEWSESAALPVPFVFFLTTNGTLFTEERKQWFRQHAKTIAAGVSYDGTAEMQTANRGTDINSIDLDFFHETWPSESFHMTISKESLPHLAKGVLSIQRRGYDMNAALAQGIEWNEQDANVYYNELMKLSDEYITDSTLKPLGVLTRYLKLADSSQINAPQEKYCGTGTHMVAYDVDGTAYGCHIFTPIVMGDKATPAKDINWTCRASTDDPFCSECIFKNICHTCSGFNLKYRGNLATRDKSWCRMIYVQNLAACEFQLRVLAARKSAFSQRDAQYAKVALETYQILKTFPFNACAPFTIVKKERR